MVYYRNLDFLRFIAVFLVLFQHWLFHNPYIDLGKIGVTIFFVLSGFLITGILLKNKQEIENKKISLQEAFKNFYIRRSLRIFPIYFLLIGFLFILNNRIMSEHLLWFLTYTSNIKTYIDQNWMSSLGPLWTLAVEEQFYLVWPALIFLVPMKNIRKLLIACLMIGPLFRLSSMLLALSLFKDVNLNISSIVLMPANIDLFAIGGILAYNIRNKEQLVSFPRKTVMLLSFVLLLPTLYFLDSMFYHIFFVWIIAVWSYFIISILIDEKENVFNRLFQFKPFLFLGKISYGLYLYHGPFFFIFAILSFIEMKVLGNHILFWEYQESKYFLFLKNIAYLIFIASISWFLIEKPINKLKRFYV